MKKFFVLLILLTLVLSGSTIIEYGYKVGDKAIDFKLKNVDGNYISMSDNPDNNGYIIVFTCNTCPWARGYEQRIINLHKKYVPEGFPVIAIQPNDPEVQPGDSFEEMQKRAEEYDYPYPYVIDAGQDITIAYGATKTPHVYLLERVGSDYFVRYIGGIDNSPRDGLLATEKYVETAIDQLLAGEEVETTVTKAIGCSIKLSTVAKAKLKKL